MKTVSEERLIHLLLKANLAMQRDDPAAALAAADDALQFAPNDANAAFIAGCAALRMGNKGLATLLFAELTTEEAAGENFEAWVNIGCCLRDVHPADAYTAFRTANNIKPNDPAVLSNLCAVADELGRHDESLSWGERALDIAPDHWEAVGNTAGPLFSLGRWAEAWPRYNVTLDNGYRAKRNYHADRETPRWNPKTSKPGDTVVIYGEQGIGDEILYASLYNSVRATHSDLNFIIETDPRLEGLFRRSFPWATVYGTRTHDQCRWPNDHDIAAKIEMGGLGEYMAGEPYRSGGYLNTDEARVDMVDLWLRYHEPAPSSFRVGLAWTGGSWSNNRALRSLHIEQLTPILRVSGAVQFVSLEYEQPDELPDNVLSLDAFTRKGADIDDTAAVIANMDLVISVTTSAVDIAGALGVPCWALVNEGPQWRYSATAGEREMWFYESVTTYRQKERGLWTKPILDVARDLRVKVGEL